MTKKSFWTKRDAYIYFFHFLLSFYIMRKKKCWEKKYNWIGHKSLILLLIRNFRILVDFTKKSPLCSTSRCRAIVNIYVIYEAEGNFWSNKPIFFLFVLLLNIATHLLYIFMTTFFLMYDSRPGESISFYIQLIHV